MRISVRSKRDSSHSAPILALSGQTAYEDPDFFLAHSPGTNPCNLAARTKARLDFSVLAAAGMAVKLQVGPLPTKAALCLLRPYSFTR